MKRALLALAAASMLLGCATPRGDTGRFGVTRLVNAQIQEPSRAQRAAFWDVRECLGEGRVRIVDTVEEFVFMTADSIIDIRTGILAYGATWPINVQETQFQNTDINPEAKWLIIIERQYWHHFHTLSHEFVHVQTEVVSHPWFLFQCTFESPVELPLRTVELDPSWWLDVP